MGNQMQMLPGTLPQVYGNQLQYPQYQMYTQEQYLPYATATVAPRQPLKKPDMVPTESIIVTEPKHNQRTPTLDNNKKDGNVLINPQRIKNYQVYTGQEGNNPIPNRATYQQQPNIQALQAQQLQAYQFQAQMKQVQKQQAQYQAQVKAQFQDKNKYNYEAQLGTHQVNKPYYSYVVNQKGEYEVVMVTPNEQQVHYQQAIRRQSTQ